MWKHFPAFCETDWCLYQEGTAALSSGSQALCKLLMEASLYSRQAALCPRAFEHHDYTHSHCRRAAKSRFLRGFY